MNAFPDLRQDAINHATIELENIHLALEAGQNDEARQIAALLREELAAPLNAEYLAEIFSHVRTWIATNANGRGGVLLELLGLPAEVQTDEAASVAEGVIASCLSAAAAESDPQRGDDLLYRAFDSLRHLSPLAVSRWRPEFKRVAGIDGRTFDRLLNQARRGRAVTTPDPSAFSLIPTDDELGQRWLRSHPRTAFGLGEFRRYEAGRWRALPQDAVGAEIGAVLEAAKADKVRPTARLLSSVRELARLKVFRPNELWDADPDLLVCANGTLHVPSGELRPHSPDDLQTTGLAFAFDPGADAPMWKLHLERTLPEAAGFLQEYAGYCLTTDTSHEIALWLYGPPGSGKSTTLAGLLAMLGERAGLLGLADIERSSFALTNLPGKTLVVSTEQPSDFIRAGHLLNAIISGEPINVDRKFRDPVTLIPRAKLCWALNELPRVSDAGSGLFRRVKVLRFATLPEADRDPAVKQEIEREGAGILNWALEGLARLRARGFFDVPACVRGATDDFQLRNDLAAAFVADSCVVTPDARVQSAELYGAYRTWCDANGHRPKSSTAVADDWARLGFERYRAAGKTFWRGVGLVAA